MQITRELFTNDWEFVDYKEPAPLDLSFLKKIQKEGTVTQRTVSEVFELVNRLNPRGVPPHFMVANAAEQPLLLPEVKSDNVPVFVATDRQGILWTRGVFVVNGLKQSQTARDGSADNITPSGITAIDVAAFGYLFDGTDWDRLRSLPDNTDALAVGNPGHVAVVTKLLGFNGTTWDRLRSAGNNSDALATSALGLLNTNAFLRGFNGTTWDRLLASGNNIDARVPRGDLILQTYNFLSTFNGTNWDRLRSGANSADNVGTLTLGVLQSNAYLFGFDGTNWDRVRTGGTDTEIQTRETLGNLHVVGYNYLDNGETWDRARAMSGANQSAAAGTTGNRGTTLVALHGNWSINNFPATNTQATVSRAADASGRRHIVTGLHFSLTGAAAAPAAITQCVIRDGATGLGTILWSGVLAAPIAGSAEISLGGLSIVGTPDTAMTIEFTGASGAGTQQSVSLTGYTTTIT